MAAQQTSPTPTGTDTLKHEYEDKNWSEYSKRYQDRVSRFTAVGCTKLLELANDLHPFNPSSSHVLDLGAGAGRLVAELVEKYPGVKALATDVSPGMIQIIQGQDLPGVETRLVDARRPFTKDEVGSGEGGAVISSVNQDTYSHVLSSFVTQFLPKPDEVLSNMFKAARKDGLVGLAIWDTHVVPIQTWGRACKHADPSYNVPKAHDPSAWYSCAEMEEAFIRAGCKKEDLRSGQTVARFTGLDAKGFVNFWFNEGNPSAVGMVNDWYEKGNGKTQEVKDEFERIIREEFEDGERLDMWFDITVGVRR